jgi:hypothetical protein
MAPEFASRFAPVSSPPPSESSYISRDPPSDLTTYQRSLYHHTLKQAEALSALPARIGRKLQDAQTDDHDDQEEEKHAEHNEHSSR